MSELHLPGLLFSKITQIGQVPKIGGEAIISALDMGSNSFHLIVVRAHTSTSFEVLVKEKTMLRLGDVVSRLGYIDQEHLESIIKIIRSYRALSESVGASEMVALATSAFRDADNSSDVVDLIEEETGVSVSVISGRKEAELIFKAVSSSVHFPGDLALCADLGGGSLELMIGTQSNLMWSQSFNLGVGRLSAKFIEDTSSISSKEISKMRRHVRETLAPVGKTLEELHPSALIGSSGSFLTLGRMAILHKKPDTDPSLLDDLNQVAVRRSALMSLTKLILKSSADQRASISGLDSKRVEIIPAASVVLEELFRIFQSKEMILSEWALREGIILAELESYDISSGDADSIRLSSVMGVTKRFSWNDLHAEQVANLALSLFDQLIELHQLSPQDRELLHYGALLHDIGEHIAMEDHDKHSAYLIENSRLRGFSPEEKRALICIGRFHRRGTPREDFQPFALLDEQWQARVVKLVSLLRLADALDRSHEDIVTSLDVEVKNQTVILRPKVEGDLELESFGLRRKRSLFESTFKTKVVLEGRS